MNAVRVTGQSHLLENNPVLSRSIRLRNPYVDAMSLIQVELLRRKRAGEHTAELTNLEPGKTYYYQILRRDGWRCQSCGTMTNLEAHHREFRSQSGPDSEENLITLCAACHARVHGG